MLSAIFALLKRDLLLAFRSRHDILFVAAFLLIVITLYPLGISPNLEVLRTVGVGIIWTTALLASMLSLGSLFDDDFRDGTLEQLCLSPIPGPALAGSRALTHWLTSGMPVTLLSPFLAMMLGLNDDLLWWLPLSLLPGTLALSLLGCIAAALTLGVRNRGAVLAVILLPLYIPTLIFGVGAVLKHDLFLIIGLLLILLPIALAAAPAAIMAAVRD